VEELHPERNLSQNPVSGGVCPAECTNGALELPGLTLSPLQFVDTGTTRFDLEFHLWGAKLKGTTTLTQNNTEDSEGISGLVALIYSIRLLAGCRALQTLLESIVANQTNDLQT